jgi:pimeloyl-ACP methyl ester carboxylesterase
MGVSRSLAAPGEPEEQIAELWHASVRSLAMGNGPPSVVLLPGLGLLGYLTPTVEALAGRGVRCNLVDLPGFGSARLLACRPTIASIAETAAAWVLAAGSGPVTLVGHSTGAQAALHAAIALQDSGLVDALVLAGPTVAPSQRSVGQLVVRAPAAYRQDSPAELRVVPDLVRGRLDVLRMLRSACRDEPERTIRDLRVPLLLTAGRADAFASQAWLNQLAAGAIGSPWVRVVRLPGSHNNPYTHPGPLSGVIAAFAAAHRQLSPH